VESAVRYALRRSLGVELDRLVVHIGGLRYQPARPPVTPAVAPLDAAGPLLDAGEPPVPTEGGDAAGRATPGAEVGG